MSTKRRVWIEDGSYHITARGNRRNDIFKDEEDFGYYVTLLKEVQEYYMNDYEIAAYCLMDNHIHILISTKNRHLNPVKANMVNKPEDYEMSSYKNIIRNKINSVNYIINEKIILNYFNSSREKYNNRWRYFCYAW